MLLTKRTLPNSSWQRIANLGFSPRLSVLISILIGAALASTALIVTWRASAAGGGDPLWPEGSLQSAETLDTRVVTGALAISGRVSTAENDPLPGVVISATGGFNAATDASGFYTFTNLITGAYTLTPTLAGFDFTPPTRTVSVPPDAAGQDFTGAPKTPKTYLISGRVTSSSHTPLGSVVVSASSALSATTNAGGYYTITNVLSGTYTLTPTLGGYTFAPPTRTVSLPPNAAGQDFASLPFEVYLPIARKPYPYSLTGRVTDSGGAPIAGVTIHNDNGWSITTGSDGSFAFNGLPPGDYNLTASKNAFVFFPRNIHVTAPPSWGDLDFTGGPLDLSIARIKISQAVQTEGNTVPLVESRPGAVLVQINKSTGGVYLEEDWIEMSLTGLRGGQPLSGTLTVVPPYGMATNYEFSALLPAEWLSGQITLIATVDPANEFSETDETNNSAQATFTFTSVPPLDVKVVPVNYTHTPTGEYFPGHITDTVSSWTMEVYPISGLDTSNRSPIEFAGNLGTPAEWVRLLNYVRDIKTADGAPAAQFYYGHIPADNDSGGNWDEPYGGMGFVGIRISMGLDYDSTIFAHEAGHNMGLLHTGCDSYSPEPGYPYPDGHIGQWGLRLSWWPYFLAWHHPDDSVDLMSYCHTGPTWISDYVYVKLYEALRDNGARQPALTATDSLWIRAAFSADGSATLLPVYGLRRAPTQPPPFSEYAIELLDDAGAILASQPVAVDRIADIAGYTAQSISVIVPHPGWPVALVRLTRWGTPIAQRVLVSPAGPSAKPWLDQSSQGLTLHWLDPNTPALIRFTADGGQSWTTVGIDVVGSALIIDQQTLPAGEGYFEIVFADGNGVWRIANSE